ncbi:MAG: GNAT family N-acetyltransferase [Candidatus Zixiibacteriota bacterium]
MEIIIRVVTSDDHDWLLEVVRGWGADFIVTRGRKVYPTEIGGFIAENREIVGDQCEMVTLDAFEKFSGIGTKLTDAVVRAARNAGCRRLWLMTTNDNLDAIRFYQRRSFTLAAVHINALAESRRLKQAIPEIGQHGIPMRDEIEFELIL